MRRRIQYGRRFARDLIIVAVSIALAVFLVRLGILREFLTRTAGFEILASFTAGIFFTSAFTIIPAGLALSEIAAAGNIFSVAFWGALGAVLGDLLIFFFIRDTFAEDLTGFLKRFKIRFTLESFHLGFLKWMAPLLGGLIIASPLPDELGLTLMGLSKTKVAVLIPIAFCMNFLGILALGYFLA